jgi:Transposase DDE domain
VVSADPTLAPLLARFTGVYVLDSTTITLPDVLAAVWPGCGGRVPQGSAAARKRQLELDLCAGTLRGSLHPGRAQDQLAPELGVPHPAGGLRLQDLGYFKLERLAAWDAAGLFYLSRLKSGVVITTPDGQRWETGRWLAQQRQALVDQPVLVGSAQQLAGRLLAVRVPPAVAAERRRLLRADAQREGTPLSRVRLALADWTILVTNVPADRLTVQEALVLARARWQIELLFKLWKDFGHLDRWRSGKPWRILAEVYAKLIGLIIQHWLLLTACWVAPDRSLRKAAAALRAELPALLWVWPLPQDVAATLKRLVPFLARVAGVDHRRRRPAAAQLWLDPTLQWTAWEEPPRTIATQPAIALQEVA